MRRKCANRRILQILRNIQRAFGQRRLALEDLLQDAFGPAAMGLAEVAAQHVDHRIREGHVDIWILDLCPGQALRDHHQGHVAHHLGRGGDLHDVAEHLVGVGIGLCHLGPAFLEPERTRLRLEVGELPAEGNDRTVA